jgi:glycosyltransferase involved in cell wall biosynthesis
MKILQLTSSVGFYGAERMIVELTDGLVRRGCDAMLLNLRSVARPDGRMIEKARATGIPAREIECRGRLDPVALHAMRRLIREEGIDIIHSHGYKANFYALLSRTPRVAGLVATCHNWPGAGIMMRWYRMLDKAILRSFNKVVAVSGVLRHEIERSGVPGAKIVMVHNGVSCQQAAFPTATKRREFTGGENSAIVTAVGRLAVEKGYGYLIDAAREVCAAAPGTRFLIVGNGPEEQALSTRIRGAGLEAHVRLLGRREDIADILAVTDVFVMPSLTEGMPMALLEAMAAGKAVVATPVGEIPRMIDDGRSGLLVRPRDARGLAEAIAGLLKDRQRAMMLGRAARQRVEADFSAERMAVRYMEMYEEIYAAKRINA